MKLTELNPRWVGHGGEGIRNRDGSPVPRRERIGISFDCPCPTVCGERVYVPFENPADGGPAVSEPAWQREGETFELLTINPSIQRVGGCAWHGWVRSGEVVS